MASCYMVDLALFGMPHSGVAERSGSDIRGLVGKYFSLMLQMLLNRKGGPSNRRGAILSAQMAWGHGVGLGLY